MFDIENRVEYRKRMEEGTASPVLPSVDGQPESKAAESPKGTRPYNPWYSPEAARARDLERKNLIKPVPQPGIGRRVMSWVTNHLGLRHKLTVVEGGNQESDIRSIRIIVGPREVGQTSGDVAHSRIDGLEIPHNVLEHPRRYPGAGQPPPIDAA